MKKQLKISVNKICKIPLRMARWEASNISYYKLAVRCFNEALSFTSSLEIVHSFWIRKTQLLVVAKRDMQGKDTDNY